MTNKAILYAGLDALDTVFPEDKPLADKTPKKENSKSDDDQEDWYPFGW